MTIYFSKGLARNPEICPISGEWVKLGTPNLARMSLIKFYQMLQNAKVTAFTVFELLIENRRGGTIAPPPTQIRVNKVAGLRPHFL